MDIEHASRGVLYALSFTLGAMSLPTFAESTEYRRGYEQGYQDGLEDGGQQRSRSRVIIDTARYGKGDRSCNPRDKLQRLANTARSSSGWRRGFTFVVNNELCGDPAPNKAKQLDVSYHCDNGPAQRTQAREGDTVTLNCDGSNANNRRYQQITILEASYGSRSSSVFGGFLNKSCSPREKLQASVNSAQRDGRRDVVVTANNELCGDPAPNYDKQLDVSYRCDNGPALRVQARQGDRITLSCEDDD